MKLIRRRHVAESITTFRARAGAAPLKLRSALPFRPAAQSFRARAGAAPLKRLEPFEYGHGWGFIPRPRGRGPVEAYLVLRDFGLFNVAFRARAGAAPLKPKSPTRW